MLVSSQISLLDILTAFIANGLDAAGPTHTMVKLAKAPFSPTPTSDPTTFTEADFDGYAAKTVAAWAAPYLNGDGAAETIGTSVLTWSPTGSVTPNLIYGYWLMLGNGDYGGGEAFGTPVSLNGPTTALSMVPLWAVAPSRFGAVIVP
jgi:hypothetical protein